MKEGKITMAITVTLVCFALVMVMCMQFKLVNETDITSIETMREAELRKELTNWKQKYEEANTQHEEEIAKLEEYKDKQESNAETSQLIQKELEQINMSLGKTDVEGQGIVITLKYLENEEYKTTKADDLILIVNALKLAGAEAISINEERIINMSDIAYINNSIVKVNQQRILEPYIIKAIGNQTYLESALLGNGGTVDELNKLGNDVSIEKDNKIKIKKYSGEITTKYMN